METPTQSNEAMVSPPVSLYILNRALYGRYNLKCAHEKTSVRYSDRVFSEIRTDLVGYERRVGMMFVV